MNPLVTIVMRDGSRGLPGKHTRPFFGKPLWEWTFNQARAWGGAKIVVATDIPEIILQVAHSPAFDRDIGIISYEFNRPRSDIKMRDIRAAARWAEFVWDEELNPVIDLDATNPLRSADHIQGVLWLFGELNPPVLISATPSHRNPQFNMVSIDTGGEVELVISRSGKGRLQRRQDCPATWDLNCNIYVYERGFLLDDRNESPLVRGARLYEMPLWTYRDIDTLEHFEIAECLARRYLLGNTLAELATAGH